MSRISKQITYEHIFSDIQEHMLIGSNITKWTRLIDDTKPNIRKKIQKKKIISKDNSSNINSWIPYQRDKLFWCLYVTVKGQGCFEQARDKLFQEENNFKYGSVDVLRSKAKEIKAAKISLQDIEAEIVSAKYISLKALHALAIAYEKSIIYKHDRIYYDFSYGTSYTIIERQSDKTVLYLGDVSKEVEKIKDELYYIDHTKKIKGISAYSAAEVREIAHKLTISTKDEKGKAYNKQELYSAITTKLTKLT